MRQDEFQKAKRISRAIQEYLESTGSNGSRSTDLYPYLSRKGVVEKDLNNGAKFRQFLRKLYNMGVLEKLIPQCKPQKSFSSEKFMEWRFYKVINEKSISIKTNLKKKQNNFESLTSDDEADSIINKLKPIIEKLPKKSPLSFNYTERNIRKSYPRAYEKWTERELKIAEITWNIFLKVNKVAELLKRQPSAVEKRLKKMGFIK